MTSKFEIYLQGLPNAPKIWYVTPELLIFLIILKLIKLEEEDTMRLHVCV
jgi:hypothetical protein